MNILQVNKFYYPEIGGIETVVQNIAEGLPDSYTSRVLASRRRGFGYVKRKKGVEVTKTSSLGVLNSVPIAPTFPLKLRTAATDADIVHHHLPNPLSTISQISSGFSSSKIIATYHSDIVRQKGALKLYRPVLDRFLKETDRILVTSRPLLENSKILKPHRRKCEIVPLSIDLGTVNTAAQIPEEDSQEGPVILFVGRLNYYKGVEYLIDAMSSIQATLYIVGDGPRLEELRQRARSAGVTEKIKFCGFVSDGELEGYYSKADLFVLPSVEPSEAFGVVQLEAMAHELPVINTSLPTGVPWVSKDGQTGLTVPPRDSAALANAINKLLNDPKRRAQFGSAARERVEEHFTREQMIERVVSVYESLN